MSVQKKSLISQRSAVKKAILATTETANLKPATQSSVKPALTHSKAMPLTGGSVRPARRPAAKMGLRPPQ